jgi:cell wall-associated NlpC family hydrolase
MPPTPLDPRVTPARADLAAEFLRGQVEAARFVAGEPCRIVAPIAPLRRAPDLAAPLETQALFGEAAVVYEARGDWRWVQLARDGYVGYLPADALGPAQTPTHTIATLRTHAYPGPTIKRPPRFALSFSALVEVVRSEGDFAGTADGLFLYARHLAPIGAREADFVAVAERFAETPYLWGGRTSEGIDCSGLAQTALASAGVPAPRDSDMQEAALGQPLPLDGAPGRLQRGDLVFWKGHVAIMRDAATILHANGWAMKVTSEPLAEARARIEKSGGGAITSIRRL